MYRLCQESEKNHLKTAPETLCQVSSDLINCLDQWHRGYWEQDTEHPKVLFLEYAWYMKYTDIMLLSEEILLISPDVKCYRYNSLFSD
jgi:hypothetical protein